MQPQSLNQVSQTVLNQTVFSYIQTDNVFLKYLFSFIAISIMGFISSKAPIFVEKLQLWLLRKADPDYPTIKFTFSKNNNSPSIRGATNSILAWLEKIKKSIKDCKLDTEIPPINSKRPDYATIKTIRSIATETDFNENTWRHNLETHWMPDQEDSFLIDDNIWVRLSDEPINGESGKVIGTKYTLYIFTKNKGELGLKFLLNYHDKLLKIYNKKLESKFETSPHIFKFNEYDKDAKMVKWNYNEFSSARKMDHIYFEEKHLFLRAYENFLYKKIEYDTRGDPYTYSVLLYGPPGCGKTSLLKALMNYDLDRGVTSHLFVIPFSKIESAEIFEKCMLDPMVNGTKIEMDRRVYVFEDFDANKQSAVFNIRDNLKTSESYFKEANEINQSIHIVPSKLSNNKQDENKSQEIINFKNKRLENWWSKSVYLPQYFKTCIDAGYEDISYLIDIKGEDIHIDEFITALDIKKKGHSLRIRRRIKELHEKIKNKQAFLAAQDGLDSTADTFADVAYGGNDDDDKKDDEKKQDDDPMSAAIMAYFKKSDKKGKSNLNLSEILNILDGICERTGQRCIWTTNKSPPQKYFDPAFLRPGRMDMIIKLSTCSHVGIDYLLKSYYRINNNINENINDENENEFEEVKYKNNNEMNDIYDNEIYDLNGIDEMRFTPAQIKQVCKENDTVEGAILMLREICNPNKIQKIEIRKEILTGPNVITRTHSGHWFDPKKEENDETQLVDFPEIPSKANIDFKTIL